MRRPANIPFNFSLPIQTNFSNEVNQIADRNIQLKILGDLHQLQFTPVINEPPIDDNLQLLIPTCVPSGDNELRLIDTPMLTRIGLGKR